MTQQYVSVAVETSGAGRKHRAALHVRVFDRDQELQAIATEIGVKKNGSGRESSSEIGAIRRLLAGRTTVVRDHRVLADLRTLGADSGDSAFLTLDELAQTFRVDADRFFDAPLEDIAAESSAIVDMVRAVLERVGEFDTATLTRAAGYARAAGWPVTALLDQEIQSRASEPILLRSDRQLGSHELAFLTNRERPEPLKRTGDTVALNEEEIRSLLDPGGGLSRVMPGFERREPQRRMAAAVTQALNNDDWLLIEAGTGTGKSMAYLAPSAGFALRRGERVVISTNTKALQDQLIAKDVPSLQRALLAQGHTEPLNVAVVKGRSNYVCLRRWFAHERQPHLTQQDAGLRAKVHVWLPLTETGDRSELRLGPEEEHEFGRISAEGEACIASRCVYQQRNQCFLFRARRNAEHAHLVVVNHALLLSDSGGENGVLPEFERVVIDEAHHLEDQATSQFGVTIQELALPDLIDSFIRLEGPAVAGLLHEASAMLGRVATDERAIRTASEARERLQHAPSIGLDAKTAVLDLFSRLRALCEVSGTPETGYGRTLRITPAVRRSPAWAEIEVAFDRVNSVLQTFEDVIRWYLGALHEQYPEEPDEQGHGQQQFDDLELELGTGIERGIDLATNLADFILSPSADRVYWVSISAVANRLSLNAAPLHVGQMLRASLFERMRTVVMTSATLTTDGSFAYVKDRVAFGEAREETLDSPFDYRSSALLYLVDDIPEPNQPRYQPMLEQAIVELGEALEGRTMVLFTSHAALRATHRAVKEPLARHGITVLAQRADGSPRQLMEQFRTTSRTMLLGTSTFWEGVDVVGEALSALVIAKLPFAVPSDPIVAARSEQFEDPFRQFSIPQAVLRFKQGFGRLIRSSTDRGVCVVLDRRAISKRYGASFVQSLPNCSVQVGGHDRVAETAVEWLSAGKLVQLVGEHAG